MLYDTILDTNQWRKGKISNQNFLIVASAIVGILGGIAAAILKGLAHHIETFLQQDLQWKYKYYLYFVFPMIGIFLTITYIRIFIRKGRFEHGLSQIMYAVVRKSSNLPLHNVYSQIITAALTVGFGGSVGMEAPIATSGSALGSNLGRILGLNYRERTLLLACGASAGIAGAFNSPVAGMVFAIEILLPEFSIPLFIPLLISSALATAVSRVIYSKPLFVFITGGWEFKALLFYVGLAVSIGLFSVWFFNINKRLSRWFSNFPNPYLKMVYGGLLIGVIIAIFPSLYGEGYVTIQQLLNGRYQTMVVNSLFSQYSSAEWFILLFALGTLFAKAFAALVTLNSGGNGGTFGPSLVMGGILGFIYAYGINQTGLISLNTTNFIVAGMAAALAAIMHAPLTGIFLIAEITGGYILMVPLMITAAVSYFVNKVNLKHSIYTQKLVESGDFYTYEDKDRTILHMMKLKYMIDKRIPVYKTSDKVDAVFSDIVRSHQEEIPVVDTNGTLKGVVDIQSIFDLALFPDRQAKLTMEDLAQEPRERIRSDTNMYEVAQKLEILNVGSLPVETPEGLFQGFISKATIYDKYRAILKRQGQ